MDMWELFEENLPYRLLKYEHVNVEVRVFYVLVR
jgi:hypothetical protein